MFKDLILKFITGIHLLFIIFILVTPFVNSNYFLLLHMITVPFLVAHWICGDNTCVLTIVERKIRGKPKEDKDCFTCKLIEPVYDFHKNYEYFSKLTYLVVVCLWLISVGKLYCGYRSGAIGSFQDLFEV